MRGGTRADALGLAAIAATALSVSAIGALARAGAPPSAVATALALAFVPYAWLVAGTAPRAFEASRVAPVALALAVGATLVASPPTLSDDVFRYAWDGLVARAGIDPYAFAPDDPALAPLRDDAWRRVNHPEIPTIYPPVAVALFAVAGAAAPGVAPFKVVALLGHLACVPVVSALAPVEQRGRARVLFALHPLALVESALEGHVDAVAGLGLALAALALARGRPGRAVAGAALAVGTKLVGLLLLPVVARHARAAAAALAVVFVLLVAPLANGGRGSGVPGGLDEYARRWAGNGAVHALVEGGVRGALELAAGPGRTTIRLAPLAHLPALREGRPKKMVVDASRVSIDRAAGLFARALLALVVIASAARIARRVPDPLRAARLTVLVALLCAPQVHPWYLLWLLPLEIAAGGLAGLVWSAAVLVAYAPLDGWVARRAWEASPVALAAELAVVGVALVVERRLGSPRPGAPAGEREPGLSTSVSGC